MIFLIRWYNHNIVRTSFLWDYEIGNHFKHEADRFVRGSIRYDHKLQNRVSLPIRRVQQISSLP